MSAPEPEKAATVTRGTVRCSAWLAVAFIGIGFLDLYSYGCFAARGAECFINGRLEAGSAEAQHRALP